MKKSLLTMAIMATAGIFAQKSVFVYTLDLEKDLFTGEMDTVNLSSIKFDYLGTLENPKVQKYEIEDYSYNKNHSRFEQTSRLETFGTPSINNNNGEAYTDSVVLSFPAKDGKLAWQPYHKIYSTKDAQKRVSKSTSYTDLSYFNYSPIFHIPKGFILSSRENHTYSTNTHTIVRTELATGITSGLDYVSDSTIHFFDKQNRDSLDLVYALNDDDRLLYLSSKTTKSYIDDRTWTETRISYDTEGMTSSHTKTEHTFKDFIEVTKTYNFDEGWALSAIDSTFYETDSISNVTKTYEMSFLGEEFELSKISYTSKSRTFIKGNPIPVAPTNFTVWSLLSSLRTDGTQETHPGYELKWDDNSYNETGFEIYRKVVGTTTEPTLIHTTTANMETYTDHDVVKDVVYDYFIIAKGEEAAEGSQIQNKSLPVSARSDGTSGIEEQIMFASLAVSPNPTENGLIKLNGLQGTATYEIYNLEGQQVSQGTINGQETLVVNEIQNGMYLLKIQQAGQVKTLKFERK